MRQRISKTFDLREVTEKEVLQAAREMKSSKSLGPDQIQADLLKRSLRHTISAVTHIINLSIRLSKFPLVWKVAKVIAIWKGGDPLSSKEYRPVSQLCPLSRLTEILVNKQVVEYLENNGLIASNIHGYRKGHGCHTSLIELTEEIVDSGEVGDYFCLALYDQSSAFDLVDHEIFLQKIKLLGFGEKTIEWYRNFLTDRSQYVHVDGMDSSKKNLQCGAPQGSSSGPIIWLIYTLDLPMVLEEKMVSSKETMKINKDMPVTRGDKDRATPGDSCDNSAEIESEIYDHEMPSEYFMNEEGNQESERVNKENIIDITHQNEATMDNVRTGWVVEVEDERENDKVDITKNRLLIFADDLMNMIRTQTLARLRVGIIENYERLQAYCDRNRLRMNSLKTHFMCIMTKGGRKSRGYVKSITMGEKEIDESCQERILGTEVSNVSLHWENHVSKILKEYGRRLNALKRGGKYFEFKRRVAMGRSICLSGLYYCIESWGPGITIEQERRLQIAQNKVLRWMVGGQRVVRTENLGRECGELTINQIIRYRVLKKGLETLATGRPEGMYQGLLRVQKEGNRDLRSDSNPLRLPLKTYMRGKTWSNLFLSLYYQLPTNLRSADTRKMKDKRSLVEWVRGNVNKQA